MNKLIKYLEYLKMEYSCEDDESVYYRLILKNNKYVIRIMSSVIFYKEYYNGFKIRSECFIKTTNCKNVIIFLKSQPVLINHSRKIKINI